MTAAQRRRQAEIRRAMTRARQLQDKIHSHLERREQPIADATAELVEILEEAFDTPPVLKAPPVGKHAAIVKLAFEYVTLWDSEDDEKCLDVLDKLRAALRLPDPSEGR